MAGDGIEFGGHTMSHPILTRIPEKDLRLELEGGKARLEKELGRPVLSFCYPVGLEEAHNPQVVEAVGRADYRFATIAQHGINYLGQGNPLTLRRIRVSPKDSPAVFRERISFPGLIAY